MVPHSALNKSKIEILITKKRKGYYGFNVYGNAGEQ